MRAPLVPCAGCDRHVRSTDGSCPFCGTARQPAALERAPLGRVGYRAAVVLAGAAALSACEKQPKQDPPIESSSGNATAVAVYGPPPMMTDAAAPAPQTTPGDAGKSSP